MNRAKTLLFYPEKERDDIKHDIALAERVVEEDLIILNEDHQVVEPDVYSMKELLASTYDDAIYVPENPDDKKDCHTISWIDDNYEDWVCNQSNYQTNKFSVQEYSEMFNISRQQIYKDIKSGKIQAEKGGNYGSSSQWVITTDKEYGKQKGTDTCICSISERSVDYAEEGQVGSCFNYKNNKDCKWRKPSDEDKEYYNIPDEEEYYGHNACFLKLKIMERDSPEAVEMQNRIKKIDPEAQWFGRRIK